MPPADDPVSLRAAEPDDRDMVLRMRLAFIADVRSTDPASFTQEFVDATAAYLDDVIAVDRIRTWLAEDPAAGPVGVVSVLTTDAPPLPENLMAKEGYLVNMWVEPAFRRQGIARRLLDAAIAAAPAEGWRRIHLFATDDGRPLYEAAGFRPDPRWMGLRTVRAAG